MLTMVETIQIHDCRANPRYKSKGNVTQNEKTRIFNVFDSLLHSDNYISTILKKSQSYLQKEFSEQELSVFYNRISYLQNIKDIKKTIRDFTCEYIKFVKTRYQNNTMRNAKLDNFINNGTQNIKIIWGDCLSTLKQMKSESIHQMVTSPPYYNARDYSHWENLNLYLDNMREIIRECYRVLDNHRVFVFNVGDIFDNDNLKVKSVWGKRRIPLGAYFTRIFEEVGFTFVDDFIWDKGEVQSERHKNGNKPYPFYQYPMNCYEHLMIFHKHRLDKIKYPCPVCGCLDVNGNSQSEIGIQSWECKNDDCFERSKCNRGKRFSLKTIFTQGNQSKNFEINKDLIKKWRRDIVK
ncbi:MAG: hypothetical protein LBC92_01865, partial [Rickettsiales bacterium]|nr:hypothetical protein [Rickettsiales bacterium]